MKGIIKMKIMLCLAVTFNFIQIAYLKGTDSDCNKPADIMVLLDGSDSIRDPDWMKIKDFLKDLVGSLEIHWKTVHLGVEVYSTEIGDVLGLQPFKSKEQMQHLVPVLKQPQLGTNTDRAIEVAVRQLKEQGRNYVPKIILLITDGRSRNPKQTINAAKNAKGQGIVFITLGIGNEIFQEELKEISSSASDMFESSFSSLSSLLNDVRSRLCQVIEAGSEMKGDIKIVQ